MQDKKNTYTEAEQLKYYKQKYYELLRTIKIIRASLPEERFLGQAEANENENKKYK